LILSAAEKNWHIKEKTMKIQRLKTNHLENPLGYQFDFLHLSWEVVDASAAMDKWTLVEIALDDQFQQIVFTSGRLDAYGRPYYSPDVDLSPETKYYWRVTLATEQEGAVTSQPAWFETGVSKDGWEAEWIAAETEGEAMPEFYRIISIDKPVKKARLYSYAAGLSEAYLNGKKLGDEFLLPGYHSYDLIQQYQTYDVTEELVIGNNRLSFVLGNGWYKGRFGFEGGFENLYGDRKKLIAMVKVEYEDGSSIQVATDDTWDAVETEILSNNIYDGEVIDCHRAKNPIKVEMLNDSKEKLTARYNVPLRKVEEYTVQKIIHTPSGATILDFGTVITGWVEVKGAGSMDFLLQYGEFMQDGEIYRTNLRTAKAEFSYTGEADGEWVRPHFTYYGFRYVQVHGIDPVRADQFVAYRLMSDIEETGNLVTSNEKVNQLIQNSLCSQKCNFIDVPLDCPQRDERMGWTGDIALFVNTGSYLMYTPAFLYHYMINLGLEQKELNGAVPFFVPKPKPEYREGLNPFYITAGACTWGDVATIVPWTLYQHYENKEMLKKQYPIMCAWVDYVTGRVAENEKPYLWQNDRQLGDWLALDNGNIHNPIGNTDTGLIASSYYYYSTLLCEKAAEVLAKAEDAQKWHVQAQNIKKAIIREYLDETGELKTAGTQTAYAILLYLGLYEEAKKQALLHGLKQELEKYQYHISTGFVGTGMLMDALSDNGLTKEAYTLLLQESYPSWLREVNLGATTIWERWNSVNDGGRISDTGMNSLNHYTYGCVTGWMYENLCGFGWEKTGEFNIEPKVDERLRFVEGKYQTTYGECGIRWEWKENGKLRVRIRVPFQAKVNVVLPWGEKHTLTAGNYFFES